MHFSNHWPHIRVSFGYPVPRSQIRSFIHSSAINGPISWLVQQFLPMDTMTTGAIKISLRYQNSSSSSRALAVILTKNNDFIVFFRVRRYCCFEKILIRHMPTHLLSLSRFLPSLLLHTRGKNIKCWGWESHKFVPECFIWLQLISLPISFRFAKVCTKSAFICCAIH